MLNGQNNYQTAPPGGGGFPLVGSHGNMQGMQYGMGPGRGPGGMQGAPQARGQFMGGMQGGMQGGGMGNPPGVFNAQAQMNGGLGLGGAPPGLGAPRVGAAAWTGPARPAARRQAACRAPRRRDDGSQRRRGASRDDGRRRILRPGRRRHRVLGDRDPTLAMINKGGRVHPWPGGMGMGGMGKDQTPFDMSEFPSLGGRHSARWFGRAARRPGHSEAWARASGSSAGWTEWDRWATDAARWLQAPPGVHHPERRLPRASRRSRRGRRRRRRARARGGGGPSWVSPAPSRRVPGRKLDLNGPMGGGAPYRRRRQGAGGKGVGGGQIAAATDRFGLLGLLGVIRMSDPDLTTLALGTDLTTLGLNLNSPEPLYKTFGSPWADTPPWPEVELLLPACYSVPVAGARPAVFQKFQQETLFYVFYSMPGDESRLFAADELCARGWGFHKELKAWIMRVAGTEPVMKSERGERGSFWIFDVMSWERIRKDNFNLQYDQLEARPEIGDKGAGGKETKPPAGGLLTASAGK